MQIITFDIAQFRINYPEFSSIILFPDSRLEYFWDQASCFISTNDFGRLHGDCRALALNLLTAHYAKLSLTMSNGNELMQSASVDRVSISVTPPPLPTQFYWDLNTTAYGQQALALLKAKSVGGFLVGGSPVRSGFRRFDGSFHN